MYLNKFTKMKNSQVISITNDTAQSIVDAISKRVFELIIGTDEEAYRLAERKAIIEAGYQPSVYKRKMQAIWDNTPWNFKAFEYMEEEDFQ